MERGATPQPQWISMERSEPLSPDDRNFKS
jgi:hypothetical protein